jgi:hypothetical protein
MHGGQLLHVGTACIRPVGQAQQRTHLLQREAEVAGAAARSDDQPTAIHARTEAPFPFGSAEFRRLPSSLDSGDIVMSHVSVNFDRSGFQRDLNVIYPIDRLRVLAAEAVIGSVADTHYAVLGATDPAAMQITADQLMGQLQQDRVDAVLLVPV